MVSNLEQLYIDLNFVGKKEFIKLNSFNLNTINDCSLRYKNAIEEMHPEAMFLLQNEPLILFFNLEDDNNHKQNITKIHKQAWNFDKAPIIVISTQNEIVFYNAFDFDTYENKLSILAKSPRKFQDFSYENLYNGSLFNKFKNKFTNKNRVNYLLFQHIKDYRKKLIDDGLDTNLVNSLLSRIIFLKYLQDREIVVDNNNHNIINESFLNKNSLYNLFKNLKKKFNGDLFDIDENEENIISNKNFETIKCFANSTSITGQMRLLPFDFSIIPIELISNIYESFLNSKQTEIKAYYTPTFLVDYMINSTISPYMTNINKIDSNCKVLDPACGSGIFLIEALRKIIHKEEQLNNYCKIDKNKLKKIIENNIFGIDKDESAINIAIFSLYITLLDYQDPRSILDFKFPHLKGKNFFTDDFFNLEGEFNSKIKNIDFILSNPPYGSIKDIHLTWAKNFNIPISDNQIAQSFMARVKDFSNSNTKISMVITSKIFYNANAKEFRKYLLSNNYIEKFLELSSVRRLIFQQAVPPVCVITYRLKDTKTFANINNVIQHYTLRPNLFFKYFKTILIEKNDIKDVEQRMLLVYDWLWKILLYGNILDFYFIKRLKSNYKSLKDLFSSKQGLIIKGKDRYDSSFLCGLPYIDTKKKALEHFCIRLNDADIFNQKTVHRARTPDVYKGEKVLLKRGLDTNLSCVASFCKTDVAFTNSINSIKLLQEKKEEKKEIMQNLVGLLNSDIYTYLNLLTSSAVGVERNEIYENEYLAYPYIFDKNIVKSVNKLSCSSNYSYNEINAHINNAFNLSNTEKDLIDYAINVSIPIWKLGDNTSNQSIPTALMPVSDAQLKDYANIFVEIFSKQYKNFNVDIYRTKNCTLMNFKVNSECSNFKINLIPNNNNLDKIFSCIADASIQNVTNEIFIKKDIKGFNDNSFYILKTNELKNWHKAIARLDANDFYNALWEAELEFS